MNKVFNEFMILQHPPQSRNIIREGLCRGIDVIWRTILSDVEVNAAIGQFEGFA